MPTYRECLTLLFIFCAEANVSCQANSYYYVPVITADLSLARDMCITAKTTL